MHGIRRLVLPLDGSALSNAALPMAVALARPLGASVLLVRAVVTARDVPAAQRALEAIGQEVRGNEVDAAMQVVVGEAVDQVPALLTESDLVVLGLSSRREFGRLTRRLIADRVPVVLRRAGGRRVRQIARVAAEPAEPAAAFAAELARGLGAACELVDPDAAQAGNGCDLLVVGRARADRALDADMVVALLIV